MQETGFAPVLFLSDVAAGIEFYTKAFGAKELRRFSNDDGSVHVAEMELEGTVFHMHEEVAAKPERSADNIGGVRTAIIGFFSKDPDALTNKAVAAGAKLLAPMTDFEYGLRQGDVEDPFGQHWCFQKRI